MKIIILNLITSNVIFSQNIPPIPKPEKTQKPVKPISCSVYGLLGLKMFYGKEFQTIVKEKFKNNKWTVHYMKIKIDSEYVQQFLGSINRNDTKINYENLGKYKYIKSWENLNILTHPLGDNSYRYEVNELIVKNNKIYGKIRIFEKVKEFEFYKIK